MSTPRSGSRVVMTAAFVVVLVLAAVMWAATVANTVTIRASDTAGNALSHAQSPLRSCLSCNQHRSSMKAPS